MERGILRDLCMYHTVLVFERRCVLECAAWRESFFQAEHSKATLCGEGKLVFFFVFFLINCWSSVVASGCVATVCANLHCFFIPNNPTQSNARYIRFICGSIQENRRVLRGSPLIKSDKENTYSCRKLVMQT